MTHTKWMYCQKLLDVIRAFITCNHAYNAFTLCNMKITESTVNVEIFAWGNFRVFRDITFFAKISTAGK